MAPAEIYRFANRIIASAKGCEALFLPCAQWQGAAVVEALEQDNGIPVIACTHANFFRRIEHAERARADQGARTAAGVAGGSQGGIVQRPTPNGREQQGGRNE